MENSKETGALTLSECTLRLADKSRTGWGDHLRCRISFDLHRSNPILIETLVPLKIDAPEPIRLQLNPEGVPIISDTFIEQVLLSIQQVTEPLTGKTPALEPVQVPLSFLLPHCAERVDCSPRLASINIYPPEARYAFVPMRSLIVVDHSVPLVRVSAGVVNLGPLECVHRGRFLGQRFSLDDSDWIMEFTPVSDSTLQYSPCIQSGDYFFTHHLTLIKGDGSSFSSSEAHEQLEHLCTFLSFCCGHWVSTALTAGIAADGTVAMEEWGTRLLSPQRITGNWLHGWNGDSMTELYPLFVQRLKDPDWSAAIEHAVDWNVRSDASYVGPSGGCIMLQTTFERLAWQVLVIEKRSLSKYGFSKIPAADQLRLLLSACSIPLDIPPHLTEIQKVAKAQDWRDGPQAFVETRNGFVHPPKKTGKLPGNRFTNEVYDLGKMYLDLLILSVCGYKGLYSDRTKPLHVRLAPERVPWA